MTEPLDPVPSLPPFRVIDTDALTSAFTYVEGFHRADWNLVNKWIEANVSTLEREEAWNEAALHWTTWLQRDLGGDYQVWQSQHAILLANLPGRTARWLLDYISMAASTIQSLLKDLAWAGWFRKDVVLVFADQDDYYQYLAYHLKEGVQPASGGVCIHSGLPHLAVPWSGEANTANAVVHELTHDCLAHLQLPRWLDEGVAVTLERYIAPPRQYPWQGELTNLWAEAVAWRPPVIWDELAQRHFAFWNEQNIQSFWAGTSFYEPGASNELSYSLAEVLVTLLTERGEGFLKFLRLADPRDAGQTAALDVLGIDLGELAGTFLGAGDWRPRRKAIAEHWESAGWNKSVPKSQSC